jgi:hypothetical protein
LETAADVPEVFHILHIASLQELYFLLKISPALKGKLNFYWEEEDLHYKTINPTDTQPPNIPPMSTLNSPTTTSANIISNDETWHEFHKMVLPLLQQWTTVASSNCIAYAWKEAIHNSVTQDTTWMNIKSTMSINSNAKYYQYISSCPMITWSFKLHLDTATGNIQYWLTQKDEASMMQTPITNNTTAKQDDITILLPSLNHDRNYFKITFSELHSLFFHQVLQ